MKKVGNSNSYTFNRVFRSKHESIKIPPVHLQRLSEVKWYHTKYIQLQFNGASWSY